MKNVLKIAAVLGIMFLSSGCTSAQDRLNGINQGQCNNPNCQCPKPCQCGAGCQCGMNGNSVNLNKK
ncbi:MAG: hypothetical protein WC665_06795 [Sulfurimonas sp.]